MTVVPKVRILRRLAHWISFLKIIVYQRAILPYQEISDKNPGIWREFGKQSSHKFAILQFGDIFTKRHSSEISYYAST